MIKTFTFFFFLLLAILQSNGQTITTFNYTDSLQYFTVPANSYITIDVRGAMGGASYYYTGTGGGGSRMIGTFTGLAQGQVLTILVGGQGTSTAFTGGGGGGTFVADSVTTAPLIIAGGGGGSEFWGTGGPGVTSASGAESESANAGGINGNGGASSGNGGGGGGGFIGNGVGIFCDPDTNNGKSFMNDGAGGSGACFPAGGYGGGGGGGNGGGGGGGGYSGGAGGDPASTNCYATGGGGGSYNAGVNPIDSAGVNFGDGVMIITVYTTGSVQPQTTFNYTGTIQTFKVPSGKYISIDAFGAQGGPSGYSPSGLGARVYGTFINVTGGQVLKILVGGQGGAGTPFAAGGGGGTFVIDSATNTPLIVAGGGGGDYLWDGAADSDTSTNGTASHDGTLGGSSGEGGAANNGGGAGAGFNGDGAGTICNIYANGGKSFSNGSAGGIGHCSTDCNSPDANGGYGGGGSGTTGNSGGGGGGGGGYSGGGGGSNGQGGGGGGSYNAGTGQVDSVGVHQGDGLVVITTYTLITGLPIATTDLSFFNVYPNPANETVTFNYELTSYASITLDIYTVLGEKIALLNNENQTKGRHTLQWDVKNKVAAGIYTYRLQAGETQKTGLLVVQ